MPNQLPSNSSLVSIRDAADSLGVSLKTLRRWEGHGLVHPIRNDQNQRVYSAIEIANLDNRKYKPLPENSVAPQNQLSISQAADELGVSIKTLRRWDAEGKIQPLRDDLNRRIFTPEQIATIKANRSQFSQSPNSQLPQDTQPIIVARPLPSRSFPAFAAPLLSLLPFILVAAPILVFSLLGYKPSVPLQSVSFNPATVQPLNPDSSTSTGTNYPTASSSSYPTADTNPILRRIRSEGEVAGLTVTGGSFLSFENVLDDNYNFGVAGTIEGNQIISSTTVKAPFVVGSQEKVTNLNADLLDGHSWEEVESVVVEPNSLQKSYEAGNTITTTDKNLDITLSGGTALAIGGTGAVNFNTSGQTSFTGNVRAGSGLTVIGNMTLNSVPSGSDSRFLTVNSSSGLVSYIDTASWDKSTTDDLSTSTSYAGDVSGLYNNLQLGSGVVGSTEISDASIAEVDLSISNAPVDGYFLQTNGSGALSWSNSLNLGSLSLNGALINATATELNLLSGHTNALLDTASISATVQAYNANTSLLGQTIDGTEFRLGSDTAGDLIYFNGTNWARLAGSGTDGFTLKYNTATNAPYWAADAGGTSYTASNGVDLIGADFQLDFTTFETWDQNLWDDLTFDNLSTAAASLLATWDMNASDDVTAASVGATVQAYNADTSLLGQTIEEGELNITNGPSNGYFLQTDGSGNLTWVDISGMVGGSGDSYLSLTAEQLHPTNTALDFLLGGTSTAAATIALQSNTGNIKATSADISSIRLSGTTVGLTSDPDLLSLSASALTVNGTLEVISSITAPTIGTINNLNINNGAVSNAASLSLQLAGNTWDSSGNLTVSNDLTATHLYTRDTNQSNTLQLRWNEDDTANRILDFYLAGANRQLTLNENFTIGDGSPGILTYTNAATLTVEGNANLNQDLTTDASPTFAGLTLSTLSAIANNRLLNINSSTGVVSYLDSSTWDMNASDDVTAASIGATVQAYNANTSLLGQTIEESELNIGNAPSAGFVLQTDGSGNMTWADPGGSSTNYWLQTGEQIYAKNALWHDLLIGGDSTSSATIALQANTGNIKSTSLNLGAGNLSLTGTTIGLSTDTDLLSLAADNLTVNGSASMSGSLTIGQGESIKSAYGPLSLAYKSAADAWTTGLTIQDGTGNVGIGTTNPGYKLDVNGNTHIAYNSGLTVGTTASYANSINVENTGSFRIGNSSILEKSSGSLNIYSGAMYISALGTGNIGIGTTTPTAKLDVVGDASASGSLVLRDASLNTIDSLNGGRLAFNTSVGGDAGLTERMTILNNGNVGIGTTNPGEKLEVNGNILLTTNGDYLGFGNGSVRLSRSGNILEVFGFGGIDFSTDSGNDLFRILTSGNIGIGTAAPGYKLDVTGDINISSGQAYRINGVDVSQYFITTAGNNGQVWTSDGSGVGGWGDLSTNTAFSTWDMNSTDDVTIASVGATVQAYNADTSFLGQSISESELDISNGPALGYVLQTDAGGTMTWVDPSAFGGANNYWDLSNEQIYAKNALVMDLLIGGDSTAAATIALQANTGNIKATSLNLGTGNLSLTGTTLGISTDTDLLSLAANNLTVNGSASMSGSLTIGQGQTIKSAYGPLSLAYKSAADAWTTGLTLQDGTGNVGLKGVTNPNSYLQLNDISDKTGITLGVNGGNNSSGTGINFINALNGGTNIKFSNTIGGTNGTGISFYRIDSGSYGITFGSGAAGYTNGTGIYMDTDGSTGKMIDISGSDYGYIESTTNNLVQIQPTKTTTAGGPYNDTANYLKVARNNTVNGAGVSLTHSGNLVDFSSNCTQTDGSCIDTAAVLSVSQLYTSATGAVLNLTNAGSGSSLRINDDGTFTDSTPFIINDSGDVGIGNAAPGYKLDVTGDINVSVGQAYRINGSDVSQYFITTAGNSGQVWTSDGSGVGGWGDLGTNTAFSTWDMNSTDDVTIASVGATVQAYNADTSFLGQSISESELDISNSVSNGYVLQTDGSGVLSWVDLGLSASNYWLQTNEQIYAKNALVMDLLIGGDSTAAATIALQANTGNIKATSLNLGTGNLSLAGTTIGLSTDTDLLSLASGALTVNGSLTVAGNILPSANNTYDLGSDSYRFKDLFLGGTTIHLGTSTTDEGTISYDTSNNVFNFSTDATTNGDIAFFGDDLYIDKSTGRVGIGTTTPSSAFEVAGASSNISNSSGDLSITSASTVTLNAAGGDAAGEDVIITAHNLTLAATGALSITPDVALTTAIDLTDTDLTNALSIGDNNIIGTTAAIDFTNFDVSSTGVITNATWNGVSIGSQYGGSGANNSTAAQYSIPYYSATGVLGGVLAPDSAGYVLSTNSTGSAPSWIDAGGVGTNYWLQTGEQLYAKNALALDLLIGGTSTSAATIALQANTGNIKSTSLNLGAGNLSLTGTTLGISTDTDLLSLASGALTVNGSLTVAGNILPSADDTYDLGSTTARFKDLYLGGETLHLGTSLTDEATISYSSSNILSFDTDSTTNGDIAFFTDDLYLDKSTGRIGIGTTNPGANLDITADAVTTGTAVNYSFDGLTTGTGINIQSTSNTNSSDKLLNIDATQTRTSSQAISGNLLALNRGITYNPETPVITQDNKTNVSRSDNASSWTFSHTVGASSNMVLMVLVSMYDGLGGNTVSSITYGGQSLTHLVSSQDAYNYGHALIYYLVNPPTGANNVVATFTGGVDTYVIDAISYYNVNTSSPFGNTGTSVNANPSVTFATNATQKVIDAAQIYGCTPGVGPGQTLIDQTNGRGFSTEPGGASSTTMSWTGSCSWGNSAAAAINPTAAASLNVAGALASISSTGCSGTGTCTDSANLLSLTQSSSTSTGSVLKIANSGLGIGFDLTSNSGGQAAMMINNTGAGDILTASASGITRMTLANNGDLNLTTGTYRMAGTDVGQYFITSAGNNGQVWTSDGSGVGGWADAATSGSGYLQLTGEQLAPSNLAYDILLGDTATATATIALQANTGNIKATSLNLGTGNLSLTGTTLGLSTDTDLLSLASGALTVNGSLTVAGNILPSADDTYDLGSTTARFKDLYLGGETIHLGSSLTDEATISYNSSNILSFGTDSTTNGDIAFFTDDLYLDKSTGNIGIGTIDPTTKLDVNGPIRINRNDSTMVMWSDNQADAQLVLDGDWPSNDVNLAGVINETTSNRLIIGQFDSTAAFRGMRTTGGYGADFGMFYDPTTSYYEDGGSGISVYDGWTRFYSNGDDVGRFKSQYGMEIGIGYPTNVSAVCSDSGGSIPAGTYYFTVAANTGSYETQAWSQSSCTITTGSSGSITVSWTDNSNGAATGFTVYKGAASWSYDLYKSSTTNSYAWTTDTGGTGTSYGHPSQIDSSTGTRLAVWGNSFINNGGNFGIGTTGPDRKLDVLDATNPQLRLTQADGTVYSDFQMNSSGDLVMNVDGVTNQLVLDNSGNIGIGTASPQALLNLQQDFASTNTMEEISRINRTTSGAAASGIGTYTSTYLETAGGTLVEAGRYGYRSHVVADGAAGSDATNNASQFIVYAEREKWDDMFPIFNAYATGADRKLCMNGIDNVDPTTWDCFGMGIGVTNALTVSFDNNNRFNFQYGNSANAAELFIPNVADHMKLTTAGTQPIIFDTSNDGIDVTISSAGNVGIGDTTPASLFTVGDGDLFQVNSSGIITSIDGVAHTVDDVSGNLTLTSNSSLVYIADGLTVAGNILPSADNTYDLGSDSNRFKDLYLGGNTLHLGTSTTDEATFGYNTTNNILNIGTDSTTNGDIAFFTDDLYLDKSTGYVGIGTTTPGGSLDVAGASSNISNTSGDLTIAPASDLIITSNVGIGTTNPSGILHIAGTPTGTDQVGLYLTPTLSGTTTSSGLRVSPTFNTISTSSYGLDLRPQFTATSGGPQGSFFNLTHIPQIAAGASQSITNLYNGYFRTDNLSTAGSVVTNNYSLYAANPTATGTITNNYGLYIASQTGGSTLNYAIYSAGGDNYFGGNVGIGATAPEAKLQVTGGGLCVGSAANCNSDNNTEGVIYSSATAMTVYDVAENYPTKDATLTYQEIVELDPNNGVFVQRAANSYSSKLLGVISEKPAVLLGGFNGAQFKQERQVAIALSGRVPVKVDPNSPSIKIGDPLTASATIPGTAIKATQPGYVIGRALTDWNPNQNQDSVITFVTAAYADPTLSFADNGDIVTTLSTQVDLLSQTIADLKAESTDNVIQATINQTDIATISAQITTLEPRLNQVEPQIAGLTDEVATISARVSFLESRPTPTPEPTPTIEESRIVALEVQVASLSASLTSDPISLELPITASDSSLIDTIIATDSADVSVINDLNLDVESIFISDFLSVLGDTVLTTATVTNSLTVSTISSATGNLSLMGSLLSLDALGNVVTITGDLAVTGTTTLNQLTSLDATISGILSAPVIDELTSRSTSLEQLVASLSAQVASLSAQLASPSATPATASATIDSPISTRITVLGLESP